MHAYRFLLGAALASLTLARPVSREGQSPPTKRQVGKTDTVCEVFGCDDPHHFSHFYPGGKIDKRDDTENATANDGDHSITDDNEAYELALKTKVMGYESQLEEIRAKEHAAISKFEAELAGVVDKPHEKNVTELKAAGEEVFAGFNATSTELKAAKKAALLKAEDEVEKELGKDAVEDFEDEVEEWEEDIMEE